MVPSVVNTHNDLMNYASTVHSADGMRQIAHFLVLSALLAVQSISTVSSGHMWQLPLAFWAPDGCQDSQRVTAVTALVYIVTTCSLTNCNAKGFVHVLHVDQFCPVLQPVSAQIVGVLRSSKLPARSKLQCAAAALEQHPEALVTALPADQQDPGPSGLSLVDLCCHAALQSLSEQTSQESRPADATAAAAVASAEAGELVTGVSGRTALAVQGWSRNKLTQTAASQLHGQYHEQWEQLQQDCSEADGAPAVDGDLGGAGKLWAVAEAAILARLHSMGVADGNHDDASEQLLWQVTQVALDIAIVHLGWEWAYYKVRACLLIKQKCICHQSIRCLAAFCESMHALLPGKL